MDKSVPELISELEELNSRIKDMEEMIERGVKEEFGDADSLEKYRELRNKVKEEKRDDIFLRGLMDKRRSIQRELSGTESGELITVCNVAKVVNKIVDKKIEDMNQRAQLNENSD